MIYVLEIEKNYKYRGKKNFLLKGKEREYII